MGTYTTVYFWRWMSWSETKPLPRSHNHLKSSSCPPSILARAGKMRRNLQLYRVEEFVKKRRRIEVLSMNDSTKTCLHGSLKLWAFRLQVRHRSTLKGSDISKASLHQPVFQHTGTEGTNTHTHTHMYTHLHTQMHQNFTHAQKHRVNSFNIWTSLRQQNLADNIDENFQHKY